MLSGFLLWRALLLAWTGLKPGIENVHPRGMCLVTILKDFVFFKTWASTGHVITLLAQVLTCGEGGGGGTGGGFLFSNGQ